MPQRPNPARARTKAQVHWLDARRTTLIRVPFKRHKNAAARPICCIDCDREYVNAISSQYSTKSGPQMQAVVFAYRQHPQ